MTVAILLATVMGVGAASSGTWTVTRARRRVGQWSVRWAAARVQVFGPTCPNSRCRAQNRRAARYCRQCGSPVDAATVGRRPAPKWQWGRGFRRGLW